MNHFRDTIKCSVSADGINGHHTASIEMDLDKTDARDLSDELQVYDETGGFVFVSGKDSMDCKGPNPGSYVGTICVNAIDDPKCRRNVIKVLVKNHFGERPVSREISVQRDINVGDFKQKIYKELFCVVDSVQRLVYAGRTLEDNKTLAYYEIQNGASIDLIGRIRGG